MATAEEVVRDRLLAANLGLVFGLNLWVGVPRPTEGLAVFVSPAGGPPPELFLGQGQTEIAVVQVSTWGPPERTRDGITMARGILAAFRRAELPGFFHVQARESEPTPIGFDDQGRYGWAFNLELHREVRD